MTDESEKGEGAGPLVTGQIVIGTDIPAFSGATAYVRLEDVSNLDKGSELIAEAIIHDVRHAPDRQTAGEAETNDTLVPFTLHAPSDRPVKIEPKNDYVVRAWIDKTSDGQRGSDDLYSDESRHVLTGGSGPNVIIKVRPR